MTNWRVAATLVVVTWVTRTSSTGQQHMKI
jgi:hypothetical protein